MSVLSYVSKLRGTRLLFIALILACILPLVLRMVFTSPDPGIELVLVSGSTRTLTLREMTSMTTVTREGSYQNQYGNWRDHGEYSGILVSDILDSFEYSAIEVEAADGYRVTIPRARVEDPEYPMVLAFSMDGLQVPAWSDGFRIAVLPEDGGVSNLEYNAESAGSFWVKQVVRIRLSS